MSEWKEIKLGDYAKFSQGIQIDLHLQNQEPFEGCIRFIRIVDFTKGTKDEIRYIKRPDEKYIVGEDDLVMIRYGSQTAGKIAKGFHGAIANNTFKIEPNEDIDNSYLYHYLRQDSIYDYFRLSQSSSTMPAITFSMIGGLEMFLPPLEEQRAIASVLSSIDDKIDLLQRQNETLEKMAETLFRQWFVEEADENWKEGVLWDEFDFTMGQSPPGSSFNEEGNGTPMYQGNRDFGFRFPENRVFTTEPKRFAQKFDTLISVRAPVGEQNMANEKCCIGRGVAAFRYKNNPAYYTFTFFKMKSLMDEIKQFNETGTVFGSISKNDFRDMEVFIPPVEKVESFQNEVKPIDDKIIMNCYQIGTLTTLRDTLLPKLMSGEVRVNYE